MRTKTVYEFGPYSLDAAERVLKRDESIVPLTPKALETLLVLVEKSGSVVSRAELMERIWPDTFVEEQNLNFNISVLRRTLGGKENALYIETVPKRGYRFVAEVRVRHVPIAGELPEGAPAEIGSRSLDAVEASVHDARPMGQEPSIRAAEEIHWHASAGRERSQPASLEIGDSSSGRAGSFLTRLIRQRSVLVLILLVLSSIVLVVGWWGFFRKGSDLAPSFQRMRITRLTVVGNVREAAISPDGKYVVYVTDAHGQQSMWLRHVATASDVQIAPTTNESYHNLAFSPEGDQIYFAKGARGVPSTLHRIAVLGGPPQKISDNVMSRVTFSPDGRRMAFVRTFPSGDRDALVAANVDGTDERILAVKGPDETLSPGTPAWSPDGKTVACGIMDIKKNEMTIFGLDPQDGSPVQITTQRWFRVEGIAWAPDGAGLLAIATPRKSLFYQLWYIPIGGTPYRITNDLDNYNGISVARTSGAVVTVRFTQYASIWILDPAEGAINAKRLTFRADVFDGGNGVAWTRDDRIIYASNADGEENLWIMDRDGANQRQLTQNARVNRNPNPSPDGRWVIFLSDRTGAPHIWRLDLQDGTTEQLTDGQGESNPYYSPDGTWIAYSGIAANKYVIWRARADGSGSEQLTKHASIRPAISPDGRLIAYWYQEDAPASPWRIAIIPAEGGPPTKIFDVPPSAARRGFLSGFFFRAHWTPDGTAISYIDERDGVSNIWVQPINGGPARQLTDFSSNLIFDFAWAPDGKRIVCSRGTEMSDVILIDFSR